jgi:hypothetical protein
MLVLSELEAEGPRTLQRPLLYPERKGECMSSPHRLTFSLPQSACIHQFVGIAGKPGFDNATASGSGRKLSSKTVGIST